MNILSGIHSNQAMIRGQRAVIAVLCGMLVSACMQPPRTGVLSSTKTSTSNLGSLLQGGQKTDDKFERAPDIYRESGVVRWNGLGTVSGVWAAHPQVDAPRRVRMVNTRTGAEVDGMLYNLDKTGPQDALTVSSAAAEALDLSPGNPTRVSLFGLRPRAVRAAIAGEVPTADLQIPPELVARNELAAHIGKLSETEITELVAATMRGMGYDTKLEIARSSTTSRVEGEATDAEPAATESTATETALTVREAATDLAAGAPDLSGPLQTPDPADAAREPVAIDLAELNFALGGPTPLASGRVTLPARDEFEEFVQILAVPKPGASAALTPIRVSVRSESSGTVGANEIRSIQSRLTELGEIGVVVSISGFTEDAVQGLTLGRAHLELVDLDGLLGLWTTNYDRLSTADRGLLPLQPVYFLAKR